jgi:hypothetical protein
LSQTAAKNRQSVTVMYDREGANGLGESGLLSTPRKTVRKLSGVSFFRGLYSRPVGCAQCFKERGGVGNNVGGLLALSVAISYNFNLPAKRSPDRTEQIDYLHLPPL